MSTLNLAYSVNAIIYTSIYTKNYIHNYASIYTRVKKMGYSSKNHYNPLML
jgi:hypothetical protein